MLNLLQTLLFAVVQGVASQSLSAGFVISINAIYAGNSKYFQPDGVSFKKIAEGQITMMPFKSTNAREVHVSIRV